MIKALIFDNNGVMTSTEANAHDSIAALFDIETAEFVNVWRREALAVDDGSISTKQFLKNVIERLGNSVSLEDVQRIYYTFYERDSEMHELVRELSKRFEVALLTNFGDDYIEFDKRWQNKDTFGNNVYVSAYLKMKKPGLEIYKHVLENLRVDPQETIFIDDRESNLEPARAIGMKTILFDSKEQFLEELDKIVNLAKV